MYIYIYIYTYVYTHRTLRRRPAVSTPFAAALPKSVKPLESRRHQRMATLDCCIRDAAADAVADADAAAAEADMGISD